MLTILTEKKITNKNKAIDFRNTNNINLSPLITSFRFQIFLMKLIILTENDL